MQLDVNLKLSLDGDANALLQLIHQGILTMSAQLDALTAQVTQNTTVVESAITLITGLKTNLDAALAALAAGDDGAALRALSDSLGASDTALANAIAANTPAASAPAGDASQASGT